MTVVLVGLLALSIFVVALLLPSPTQRQKPGAEEGTLDAPTLRTVVVFDAAEEAFDTIFETVEAGLRAHFELEPWRAGPRGVRRLAVWTATSHAPGHKTRGERFLLTTVPIAPLRLYVSQATGAALADSQAARLLLSTLHDSLITRKSSRTIRWQKRGEPPSAPTFAHPFED